MKKKLCIFMVSVLVLSIFFVLSACAEQNNTIEQNNKIEQKNKLYDIQHQILNYTDVKCVTEKEKYYKDTTVIRYTLTNVTDNEAWINSDYACFELQKLVDGVWKTVGTKEEHCWTELAQLLPPGESETREINLEEYFYLPLEEGTYRIEISHILSNTFEISHKENAEQMNKETTISYAGWTSESSIFTECLNSDKMSLNGELHYPIFKLDTKKEFEDFKTKYGDVLSMEGRHDGITSFIDATVQYDDKFFENNTLFAVYVTSNSGSYRYGVDDVYCENNCFKIHIKKTNNPEAVTMNMAGWLVTVAVKDDIVSECELFDAQLKAED